MLKPTRCQVAEHKEFATLRTMKTASGLSMADALRRKGVDAPDQLHRTQQPAAVWHRIFEKQGFNLERTIHTPWWECCAYVLERAPAVGAASSCK